MYTFFYKTEMIHPTSAAWLKSNKLFVAVIAQYVKENTSDKYILDQWNMFT